MLLVGAVQLQRATACDCGAGIAREAEKVEEEGQWSEADTVRCAVAARGVVARHSSRAGAVDRYWIHLQLGISNGSRKGSIRRLLLVLASAIRVDGSAANGRQQKRMLWYALLRGAKARMGLWPSMVCTRAHRLLRA